MWDINHARAQHGHNLIGEMIAIDTQPFSVIENEGLILVLGNLVATYFFNLFSCILYLFGCVFAPS